MNVQLWIYLCDVVPKLGVSIGIVAFLSGAASILAFLLWINEDIKAKPVVRVSLLAALLTVVAVLIPSQKTMYLLMGTKGIEAVSNSEIGKKTQEILLQKLTEYSESLQKSVDKK